MRAKLVEQPALLASWRAREIIPNSCSRLSELCFPTGWSQAETPLCSLLGELYSLVWTLHGALLARVDGLLLACRVAECHWCEISSFDSFQSLSFLATVGAGGCVNMSDMHCENGKIPFLWFHTTRVLVNKIFC